MNVFERMFGRKESPSAGDSGQARPASPSASTSFGRKPTAPASGATPGRVSERPETQAARLRSEFLAAAGPHLAPALEMMFNEGRGRIDQHDQRHGMRALFSADKAVRGQALTLMLDWLVGESRVEDLQKVGRRNGRWAHEFAADDWQRPTVMLEFICFELAKSDLDLPSRDRDHSRLVAVLGRQGRFTSETSRKILRQLLKTVAAHPGGDTVRGLRDLAGDSEFASWMADIDAALAGAGPGGSDGAAETPPTSLPPLELPRFLEDHWDYIDTKKLTGHFGNLFEPRVYEGASDRFLTSMARIADACSATPQAAIDPQYGGYNVTPAQRSVVLQLARSPESVAFDADIYDGYFRNVLDWIAWIDRLREIFRPFIHAAPGLLPALAALSREIDAKAAPTPKWLNQGRSVFATLPPETWLEIVDKITALNGPFGTNVEPCVRTIIYLSSFLPPDRVGPLLASYALRQCYVTQPGHGIRAEKLGNACVWALAAMPGGAGIPYLARILARTKYPKIRVKIEDKLNQAAEAAGVSRGALDELSVPTHDLDRDATLRTPVGGGEAVLRVNGARDVSIEWLSDSGKPLKSPSVAMKADKAALKAVRDAAKEVEADLGTLLVRLQRLYLDDRSWPAATWQASYLDHPLVRPLARRLIWWVDGADGTATAALADDAGEAMRDVAGKPVSRDGATIRLWHPIDAEVAEVEAWRDRLEAEQITQPFAQVWREVYALTDAERATGTYTNRWAAHILKQHQAMTLARLNAWRVTHRMWVDAPNDQPWHLAIPAHNLVVDYWVEGAGGDDPETSDSGAYAFVTTDRVQFHSVEDGAADSARGPVRGRAVPLVEIPPLVFSEVMRQTDLFTAVASIAADPNWLDRGGDAAHPSQWGHQAAVYWNRTNTADLEESGKRRRAMLERIVPRLKIADKLSLDDRYLLVEGKRHAYRIHLGSGACFRGERHICIVPKSSDEKSRIWLPFEGDRTLSIIISKALLLAADDKITDPVILQQL